MLNKLLEAVSEWENWIWPSATTFISGYDFTETHHGVDIGAPEDSDVWSPTYGTVTNVGWDEDGYGNYVSIKTYTGENVILAHLNKALVYIGENVNPGTVVGKVGSTGNSSGPHIHFEIRTAGGGGYVSPWDIFGDNPDPGEAGDYGTAPPWAPGEGQEPGEPGDGDEEYLPIVTPIGKVKIPLPKINWVNVVIILGGIILVGIAVSGLIVGEVAGRALSPVAEAIRASD